ncbi:cell division protein FtsZ [Rhodoplanes serenus]|jgi:cell division protein FtsZ|uniref:Cell division protein FtsZ n=2 Tax=Rhodoplanes serenus TaxID=200615 RepID=A0A3S4B6X9_9BRAD|nr:cell division protein FtsZ [Rhodoplanes serenus]MTW15357.1 cell division protein FtsZ [Rhodoplanes serenus]VCU10668.1 Cell division protein FtsZ [Rhodoplanes serenus]
MSINLKIPDIRELKPRITVFGVGGAGGNAVNNMIRGGLQGVDFVVANTDAQALTMSQAERIIQMGVQATEGLGAGSQPDVGRSAAEEVIDEIRDHLTGAHMVFVTAGMGGGTGTGASPVVARAARELGILTVGVVTKPFHFEGQRRMRLAENGIAELQKVVDTLIIIPNQNLFRIANEKTTFADAFAMADQVLYSGVGCITDLMVKEGLINLDFADVRAVMREMGKAMMGTGEATGEKRALRAAEAAIANPLIDDVSMKGARGLLISITGGKDLTLYEVDEAATRIREEVDADANIIVGATFDESLEGVIRVSVVATGVDQVMLAGQQPQALPGLDAFAPRVPAGPTNAQAAAHESRIADLAERMRADNKRIADRIDQAGPTAADRAAIQPLIPADPAGPSSIDAVATAAVADALAPREIEDVTIRPIQPKPTFFPDALGAEPPMAEEAPPAVFIPPQPERPASRPPRMPRIDELPLPAQNELRAQRGDPAGDEHPEKRRMTLLQRLAAVGLGRREDEARPAEPRPQAPPQMRTAPQERPDRPMPRMPRTADPVSDYARRPGPAAPAPQAPQAPQGLDMHGRPAPLPTQHDEDQLDIPAFLRRQAN